MSDLFPPAADATWRFGAPGTARRPELAEIGLPPAGSLGDEQRRRKLQHAGWKRSLTFRKAGQSVRERSRRRAEAMHMAMRGPDRPGKPGGALRPLPPLRLPHALGVLHLGKYVFISPGQPTAAGRPSATPTPG